MGCGNINQVIKDCRSFDIPKDFDTACKKVKSSLKHGSRVYWYYKDEKEFADQEGMDIKEDPPYSGIVVAIPDTTMQSRPQELDFENCMIVMDNYPTEKCYPEATWMAINRLLDNEDLVEIFEKEL
ncbi:hypothetical protein LCGC14_1814880 [marine sediment metagenome]|uniref:Uncharacterized protein n=1 Tax=marine sediment metagenome TaxID=412755 RepID=A0A0F9GKS0_9ZZZZ